MDIESKDRIARIRNLNDAFRRTFFGGRVMLTCGVAGLPDMVKAKALLLVASFDQFTEGNDPLGEHDFGSFVLADRTLFWKIDYYDRQCKFGSEDPADPERTTRVLTIMLASEY
jgi:hypothetical protein